MAKVNPQGTALVFCGYIGGAGYDEGEDIALDSNGSVYVTGETTSTQQTFPVRVGPALTHNGGTADAFVAKVNPQGTALVYCGYIGGSSHDDGDAIAVDAAGQAYVTGGSFSSQLSFPVRVGPDLTYNGNGDAYIAKVAATGRNLIYCGYIGGSGFDDGDAVPVDATGHAYVTGETGSNQQTFPVAVGPDLTYNGGATDAFVAKVNPQGTGLLYCGYIGGAGVDRGWDLKVTATGDTFVIGETGSNQQTFPVTVGPDLTYNGGNFDTFAAKVNPQGTGLVYCSYIGGANDDFCSGVAVDAAGNAYVTGWTGSNQVTFPVTAGPAQTYNGGNFDAYAAKIALTLLQGSNPLPPRGSALVLTLTASDDAGFAYVLGSSFSTGPIKIGTRTLGLGVDNLLVTSVNNYLPATFVNYVGRIGANGQAAARINIPSIAALKGVTIHTAFVTLLSTAPFGIKSISNTYSAQIQ